MKYYLILTLLLAGGMIAHADENAAPLVDTIRVCRSEVPYLLHYTDAEGQENKHRFENHLESWTGSDGKTFTLAISEPVAIELDEEEIYLDLPTESAEIGYNILLGNPDRLRIQYDSAWAAQSGKKDTVGVLEGGSIQIGGLPYPLADREYEWTLEVYNDSSVQAGNACNIPQYPLRVHVRNAGMIGIKYGKLLFVPNGEDRWVGYEWYKNGKNTGKTEQYYHEDGKLLAGEYEVIATDKNGQRYRSTPLLTEAEEEEKTPIRGIEVMRMGDLILYK